MSLVNDFTTLATRIENRLGLTLLLKHLPKELGKDAWIERVIKVEALPEFSAYFPYFFKLKIDDSTCYKRYGGIGEENSISHGNSSNNSQVWYYIKDEIIDGVRILGLTDIDFLDYSTDNMGISGAIGANIYVPQPPCVEATFETILGLQMNADMASLYNSTLYIDFDPPNRFRLVGYQGTNYDLSNFTITLIVEHTSLVTITPTKMPFFIDYCTALIARFLYQNLKYYDGLETSYINIDLKLNELQEFANTLDQLKEKMAESAVTWSNDNQPMIWSV